MINPDVILERESLKSKARKWRNLAFLAFIITAVALGSGAGSKKSGSFSFKPFIARVTIEGVIFEDSERDEKLNEIANDSSIKAVILNINSPGGTAVGGEVLFNTIKNISTKKPVVVVMQSMATSAAYLISLPAARVFAHHGTITGSIGVIAEIPNLKDAADKLGVKYDYVKTSPLKGSPNLFEARDPASLKVLRDTMEDFYQYFIDVVAESRNLPKQTVKTLADGRIYSAKAAVKNGLIDQIGDEKDAVKWLITNKKVASNLKIQNINLEKPQNPLEQFLGGAARNIGLSSIFSGKAQFQGLML